LETFRRGSVDVKTGGADLEVPDWQPVKHGRTLWQIGTAHRSGGDNYRHYDNSMGKPLVQPVRPEKA
jgi:hypothetical protein